MTARFALPDRPSVRLKLSQLPPGIRPLSFETQKLRLILSLIPSGVAVTDLGYAMLQILECGTVISQQGNAQWGDFEGQFLLQDAERSWRLGSNY